MMTPFVLCIDVRSSDTWEDFLPANQVARSFLKQGLIWAWHSGQAKAAMHVPEFKALPLARLPIVHSKQETGSE